MARLEIASYCEKSSAGFRRLRNFTGIYMIYVSNKIFKLHSIRVL